MKTDDLVAALSADMVEYAPPQRALRVALAAGTLVSLLLLFLTLKPRGDLEAALHSMRFLFKFVVTLALAVPAVLLARRFMTPLGAIAGWARLLWLAPLLLLLAVGVELWSVPESAWWSRLVGSNSRWCLAFVPIFSTPVLAGLLVALKRGAPTRPRLAGFFAGLAAGGIGAAIYAVHCTDDSPLFVAVWYSLGIAIVTAIGVAVSGRVLRW